MSEPAPDTQPVTIHYGIHYGRAGDLGEDLAEQWRHAVRVAPYIAAPEPVWAPRPAEVTVLRREVITCAVLIFLAGILAALALTALDPGAAVPPVPSPSAPGVSTVPEPSLSVVPGPIGEDAVTVRWTR